MTNPEIIIVILTLIVGILFFVNAILHSIIKEKTRDVSELREKIAQQNTNVTPDGGGKKEGLEAKLRVAQGLVSKISGERDSGIKRIRQLMGEVDALKECERNHLVVIKNKDRIIDDYQQMIADMK